MKPRILILAICVLCVLLLAPVATPAQDSTEVKESSGQIWMISTYYWEDEGWVKHASWNASFMGQDLWIWLDVWNWEPEYSGFWASFDNFYLYGDTDLPQGLIDDFDDGVISPIWEGAGESCAPGGGAEACEAYGVITMVIPEGECPPWVACGAKLRTPEFVVHGEFDVHVDFTLDPSYHETPNTAVKLAMVDGNGRFPSFEIRNTRYQSRAVGPAWNFLIRQTHTDHLTGRLRITRTFVPDSDGDGVADGQDHCPLTAIPEAVPTIQLGVNRWALVDADLIFDTVTPNDKPAKRSFITADTGGCSCEQIIAGLGLGKGHEMYGCSTSVLKEWMGR